MNPKKKPHNPTPAERDERVSLAPLDPEEVTRDLLATDLSDEEVLDVVNRALDDRELND